MSNGHVASMFPVAGVEDNPGVQLGYIWERATGHSRVVSFRLEGVAESGIPSREKGYWFWRDMHFVCRIQQEKGDGGLKHSRSSVVFPVEKARCMQEL